ncbi:hypothetical protein Droror1_Dr00028276 [Drosera rotundifolia]
MKNSNKPVAFEDQARLKSPKQAAKKQNNHFQPRRKSATKQGKIQEATPPPLSTSATAPPHSSPWLTQTPIHRLSTFTPNHQTPKLDPSPPGETLAAPYSFFNRTAPPFPRPTRSAAASSPQKHSSGRPASTTAHPPQVPGPSLGLGPLRDGDKLDRGAIRGGEQRGCGGLVGRGVRGEGEQRECVEERGEDAEKSQQLFFECAQLGQNVKGSSPFSFLFLFG